VTDYHLIAKGIYTTHIRWRDYFDRPAGVVTMSRQDITITMITMYKRRVRRKG